MISFINRQLRSSLDFGERGFRSRRGSFERSEGASAPSRRKEAPSHPSLSGICAGAARLCTTLGRGKVVLSEAKAHQRRAEERKPCPLSSLTLRDLRRRCAPLHIPPACGGLCQAPKKVCAQASLAQTFSVTWRRVRDSNPRNLAVQQFSRLPPSTTRPTHLICNDFPCIRECKDRQNLLPGKKNLTPRSWRRTSTGTGSSRKPPPSHNCRRS